ncbi:DMT family transporter [Gemmiger sp.]
MDKKQLRNTLMLVGCAFIWGTAFVAQSIGGDYMGPYTFLAGRSWLACVFLLGLMFVLRKMGKTNNAAEPGFWQNRRVLIKGGICCGTALFAASAAQQIAIGTTSTAKAGFMTALYVVLVPVAGIFLGSRPGVKLWCCVGVSVVGLYLLCLAGRDTLRLTGGEWLLLLCAVLFTMQIMLVNHFSPKVDGIQLSFVQFFVVAVLSTIFMFVFETPTVAQFRDAAVSVAYCGIMSSGVAYTLQIVGQKELDPTIASLAMCLESVFSALAGWLILGQTLSATELCGCALMFGAIVACQLPEKKRG